jgi:hypothetical protein
MLLYVLQPVRLYYFDDFGDQPHSGDLLLIVARVYYWYPGFCAYLSPIEYRRYPLMMFLFLNYPLMR